MAQLIQLRGGTAAQWAMANPLLAPREMGVETDTGLFKIGNGIGHWNSLPYGGLTGPAQTNIIESFGDGSDGDVIISSGVTILSADVYYNNLTINGTGQLITNGYKIFVKDTLDLTNAPANAINWNGNNGVNATTQAGAAAPANQPATSLGQIGRGTAGATGVVGAGAIATAPTAANPGNGGAGGRGAAGGSGLAGVNAGGGIRAGAAATLPKIIRRLDWVLISGAGQLIESGGGGAGGGSGGGDNVVTGRGGGSGGNSGGIVAIYAKKINRGINTAPDAISAKGGNGGNGASGVSGQVGGGGGGGAGGGGWIYIVYENLIGSIASNMLRASGGNGGNGGNGIGTGIGGNGGNGGDGGRITTFRTYNGYGSEIFGTTGNIGSNASGLIGGNGAIGNIVQTSL